MSKQIPGFYIARCNLLDYQMIHKVGHTGDLRVRLTDSAYVTSFPPNSWSFAATFELPTKEDARLLETAVLHCLKKRRLVPSELVKATVEEIIKVAEDAATILGLTPLKQIGPTYVARPRKPTVAEVTEQKAVESAAAKVQANAEKLQIIDEVGLAPELKTPINTPLKTSPASEELPDQEDSTEDLGEINNTEFTAELTEFKLRDYQQAASDAALAELKINDRAILQMACRCGKTPVAFSIAQGIQSAGFLVGSQEAEFQKASVILFLVPGLSLLRQTAQKIANYSASLGKTIDLLLVGSDTRPVPIIRASSSKDSSKDSSKNLLMHDISMTTDLDTITAFMSGVTGAAWVLSTYQSSQLLVPFVQNNSFKLIIFDEAHRVCGGKAPRPFNAVLQISSQAPKFDSSQAPKFVFMTATPVYDPPSSHTISMADKTLFGGIASRYYLRQGIAAGFVNDFKLELIVCRQNCHDETKAMARAIIQAMSKVEKLLVFCGSIAHINILAQEVEANLQANLQADLQAELQADLQADLQANMLANSDVPSKLLANSDVPSKFACMRAHSRMPAGGAVEVLKAFAAPGVRAALFNCRLLQEGVEIPPLNAVFYAAPRHSPRDIIQSVCRPLNAMPGKPISTVFLPVFSDVSIAPDAPANLKRYASIVPFVDALLDEDPRLFEYLIGGIDKYPIQISDSDRKFVSDSDRKFDSDSDRKFDSEQDQKLFKAIRRVLRHGTGEIGARGKLPERLLRADTIPWDRAFKEVQRVVLECRRYPKTTDEWIVGVAKDSLAARISLHSIYSSMTSRYRHNDLEPYQRAALESLPGWLPFGAEGPYAWDYCMNFLERRLESHGVENLALEINKGGYVGLEATDMERLSGALTCVNQQVFGKKVGPRGPRRAGAWQQELITPRPGEGQQELITPRPGEGQQELITPRPGEGQPGEGQGLTDSQQAPARRGLVVQANRVPESHAKDLDRICARFGLRWRKEFLPDGTVDPKKPTFIQDAYARFKKMYLEQRESHPYIQEHFPGYPVKHAHQCALDLIKSEVLPPRRVKNVKVKAQAPAGSK